MPEKILKTDNVVEINLIQATPANFDMDYSEEAAIKLIDAIKQKTRFLSLLSDANKVDPIFCVGFQRANMSMNGRPQTKLRFVRTIILEHSSQYRTQFFNVRHGMEVVNVVEL